MHLGYYSHHSGGFGTLIAHILLRAAVYRVVWGLPLPVVLLVGLVAGAVVWRSMRHRRASRPYTSTRR